MKNLKKISLALVGLFFCVAISSAQKKTTMQKATEQIAIMNEQIISIDKSLALTEDETKSLIDLQVVKLNEVKKVKKSGLPEDEIKVELKALYKKSYKDMSQVISKEKLDAYREGKKKQKQK